MESHRKVVVIGAGVSGLVTLKTMKQLGIDCVLYESNDYHGGLWHFNPKSYGVMEFTHIDISRYNYAFSDFPFPDEGPEFAHHSTISDYIDKYVEHFHLAEDISYKTSVNSVQHSGNEISHGSDGVHHNWTIVCVAEGSEFITTCEYLVIATGHHAKPKIPPFPGEESFEGEIIHSVGYKDVLRSGYEDKNVVLIGIGNSAVDIADNLVTRGRCPEVHIASRTGAWILPPYWFGSPLDLYLTRLGSGSSLAINNMLISTVTSIHYGHPRKWGLNPKYGPSKTHPTVSSTLIHHIQRGRVHVCSNVKEIGKDYVEFEDGTGAHDVKAIIKCTGYTIQLPYLDDDVRDKIYKEETNHLQMYHEVFSPEFGTSLAMIGYIQPIAGLISFSEIQAQWLSMLIKGKCSLPSASDMQKRIKKDKKSNSHYKESTRHTIQRHRIPYCDEIASYFGAKPSLLAHPRLAHRLLLSSCGVAQWTLQGPYYNPKAKEYVCKIPVPTASLLMTLSVAFPITAVISTLVMLLLYCIF